MVATRATAGMFAMMLTTFGSRRREYALAFSASLSSAQALMASMASFGPGADISANKEPTREANCDEQQIMQSQLYHATSSVGSLASMLLNSPAHRTCVARGRRCRLSEEAIPIVSAEEDVACAGREVVRQRRDGALCSRMRHAEKHRG